MRLHSPSHAQPVGRSRGQGTARFLAGSLRPWQMVKRTLFSRSDFCFSLVLAPWCPPHSACCSSHTNSLSLWWSPHPLTFTGQLISNIFGLLSPSWGLRWLVLTFCERTVTSFFKKSFIYLYFVCVCFLGSSFLNEALFFFFRLSLPIPLPMPGWMNYKLESRWAGEISRTSDMQMTPPLWQKVKRN